MSFNEKHFRALDPVQAGGRLNAYSWFGCGWELAPLGHERAARIRHALAPERPGLPGYLADVLPGETTAAGLAGTAVRA